MIHRPSTLRPSSGAAATLVSLLLFAGAFAQQGEFPVGTGTGLTAEVAARTMTLPPGFKAVPFASEPAVHQPIAFTIDERGRLWVLENYAYPNWSPYGRDRILILEDTDGDGRHDTSKVFYDQINFGSGIAVGHGGVWVGSPPYLLFIPDRNRDDTPDGPPQVLLDGWGAHDTHETLNSFVWGPDGWLYGNQGVFTHSNVGKPGARDAERVPLNACVWRYHPTKKIFEVFAEGMSNQWGLDFNDVGDSFVTACVIPHLYHVIQGGYYQRQSGPHFNPYVYGEIKTIADHLHYDRGVDWNKARFGDGGTDAAGGGHAHAGTLIYLGDNFPDQYRGALFTHNVLGSRINHEKLTPIGSGYVGSHEPDFMRANDFWFRGLRLEIGPDGSLFNSDWYDARACHQQQPQDRSNGRIYKISYGTPKRVSVDLAALPSAELVQNQLHKNEWFVRRSRLILQERGPDPAVHEALLAIIRDNPDVTRKLRALWTLHATRGLTGTLALEFLKSPEAYLRGWTVQLMCEDKAPSPTLVSAFATLAKSDPSPVVRRFLASATQRIPVASRWEVIEGLLSHGEDASDVNLPLLYWYAAEPLVAADPARAAALASTTPLSALRPYFTRRAAALADEKNADNPENSAASGLETFAQALAATNDPDYQRELLASMMTATEGRTKIPPPPSWNKAYAAIGVSTDTKLIAQADTLAVRFGDSSLAWKKSAVARDSFAPLAARQAALKLMNEMQNFQLAPVYQSVLAEPGLRLLALRGLSAYDAPTTPDAIFKVYASFTPEEKRSAVALLAGRPAYAHALLDAVKAGTVARSDLDASLARQIRFHKDADLDRLLTEVWGVSHETAQSAAVEIENWKKELTPARLAAADLKRGRQIYNNTCALCHQLYTDGRSVGPELTGSNRGDLDYLLRNIVDPNADIGRDYQLVTIETKDGRMSAGIVQRETQAAVTLVNQAESITLSKDQIKSMQRLDVSLMPPGLLSALSEPDAADLIAYLQTKGPIQ
ncbi:MAG: c-type cytochrome [Opitutaceae bacterium]|nr:c-type cytochrome [Opitutaceae bacterium]